MRRFQLTTVHMCLCVTKVCVREGVSQRPAARHALQDEPKTIDFQFGWRARARTDTGQNRHRNTAHVTLVAHELSSETSAQSGRTGPPARSKHPAEIPTAASAHTAHSLDRPGEQSHNQQKQCRRTPMVLHQQHVDAQWARRHRWLSHDSVVRRP